MKPFEDIISFGIKLLEEDVDTDQMVPARFLRTATSSGLGPFLFYDRRFGEDGVVRPDFPLNKPHYRGESILVAGANFGCGSSREHAPWALLDFGIRAVVAPSFADIFHSNCARNGLLAVTVSPADHQVLAQLDEVIIISLARQTISAGEFSAAFAFDPFARYCFLRGLSQLDYLVQQEAQIARFEATQSAAPGLGF